MIRQLAVGIIIAVLLTIMLSSVALADQADPDDLPTMMASVYRNLLETGDQLYIFYANIPYASGPDAPVTEAFIWRLYDTDKITVLGQTVGNAYNNDGYGYNVYSIYLAATDAPTWDQPYIVRLTGNPIIFDTPPTYDFILTTVDFDTNTITADVQSALALRILDISLDLENRWSLTESLIYEQETSRVLSLVGEAFWRQAIYGVQALAPLAFQFVSSLIEAEERTWTTDYTDNVTSQYVGTWVATSQAAGQTMFSTTYDLLSIILLCALLIALIAGNLIITHNVWSGLVDVVLVSVIFSRIGIPAVLLSFLGLVGCLSWLYISAKTWGVVR